MYGTQTDHASVPFQPQFENGVKMYGTQTRAKMDGGTIRFENGVKMYGTQTRECLKMLNDGLRMM